MLKLSQLFGGMRREGAEANVDSPRSVPNSYYSSVDSDHSSTPVSPVVSLFSFRGHKTVSSSVSSLISSPGMGNSIEGSGSLRSQFHQIHEIEDDYFQHFDQYSSDIDAVDTYSSTLDSNGDIQADARLEPKKRRSDNIASKGISRLGTHISSMSARWLPRRGPETHDRFGDDLRSRANSPSSPLANSVMSAESLRDAYPPSPVTSSQRSSGANALPIDIEKANGSTLEEAGQQLASTPLLPPLLIDHSTNTTNSPVQSPLQSPSVACVPDDLDVSRGIVPPSPPLSSKPSIASMGRSRANTGRTISGDGSPPFVLADPSDEWAHKLGHANFTIQPEPYMPEAHDIDSFRLFRADWHLARCNYAKHLARTGEHYGLTSKIYKLTEQKWDSVDREWKRDNELIIAHLDMSEGGAALGLTKSNIHPCDAIKIPRLSGNDKFPELGDEEIVGPMTVAPAIHTPMRTKALRKRSFIKLLQDLVARSSPSG
ncbi:hypothetical protein V8E54_001772 [Elaphomyces granulatus]